MRIIRFIFLMIAVSFTNILYAQDVKGNNEFEGVKIGSRNYSRFKTGFFAPSDLSLGIAYDLETPRFSYDEKINKSLNGGRIYCILHGSLSKKGILSLEIPFVYRVNYLKETQLGRGYESLTRSDMGGQMGMLLSTGYCFAEKCYVTIGSGLVVDFFCSETNTLETSSGKKDVTNDLTKSLDVSISFSASFRYNRIGARVYYDIGTINRYKKKYYEQTGYPENYTKKNNHFGVGIQYYFW